MVLAPKDGNFHNTLALAEYRAGHWAESDNRRFAERSNALLKGVEASNWFFLAIALWQRQARSDRSALMLRPGRHLDEEERSAGMPSCWRSWREAVGALLGRPGPGAPPRPDLPADVFAR